jgi:phosphoserine phosphatase
MAKRIRNTKIIVAFVYDFDGTLSPGNMQEFGFIEAIKNNPKKFWNENRKLSEENDADQILTYMYLMLHKAKSENISLKRESFQDFGKGVELFNGVEEWFKLINDYGKSKGITIEHYINSSGIAEMIEGTPIAKEFKKIFACSFLYDVDGKAYWPRVAVNYTTKTQFLFKINKGIDSIYDSVDVNKYTKKEDRRIPFSRMLYFGDGDTDVPSMKLVKDMGGHSIAVYKPRNSNKKQNCERLISENRVNFVCSADYSKEKEIYKVVTTVLDKIKADYEFEQLLKTHKDKSEK